MSRSGPDQESLENPLNHLRNFPTHSSLLFRQARFPSLVLCVVLQMVMQRWDEEQVIGKGGKLLL